ncbi:hypothetical protein F4823DRAFT_617492 [Ustulina deusta]|nr:hypothetical protein F4823DRAFT_617492 [Ustulina deusta]
MLMKMLTKWLWNMGRAIFEGLVVVWLSAIGVPSIGRRPVSSRRILMAFFFGHYFLYDRDQIPRSRTQDAPVCIGNC